jgi:hypothetical protein
MRIVTSDGRAVDKFEEVQKILEVVLQKLQGTDEVVGNRNLFPLKASVVGCRSERKGGARILLGNSRMSGIKPKNLSLRGVRRQKAAQPVVTSENIQQFLSKLINLHWKGKVWDERSAKKVHSEFLQTFVPVLRYIVCLGGLETHREELKVKIQWLALSDILQWVDSVIKNTGCVERGDQIRVQLANMELENGT